MDASRSTWTVGEEVGRPGSRWLGDVAAGSNLGWGGGRRSSRQATTISSPEPTRRQSPAPAISSHRPWNQLEGGAGVGAGVGP